MTIKLLVNTLAILFGVAFLDGVFGMGMNDVAYMWIGAAELAIIAKLCFMVNK